MQDLLPTILDHLKSPPLEEVDGLLLSVDSSTLKQTPRNIFIQRNINYSVLKSPKPLAYAIRNREWKYILDEEYSTSELYNLTEDPGETRNIIQDHPWSWIEFQDGIY